MKVSHILLAIVTCMVWGGNFIAVKLGQSDFPILFMIALRMFGQGILTTPFTKMPRREQRWQFFWIGFTFVFLNFALLYAAIRYVSASTAAITHQINVPLAALLGAIWLKEKIGWGEITGIVLAFIGVTVIAGTPKGNSDFIYVLMILASASCSAVGQVLTKKWGPFSPNMLNGWSSLMTMPFMILVSFLVEDGQVSSLLNASWVGWVSVLFSTLLSGMFGYSVWYYLLNKYPINKVVVWGQLTPVFAVLFGVMMLGEQLSARIIIGGILTITGVSLVQLMKIRK
jgi:O-acetylserine/cysteine efflux transporter